VKEYIYKTEETLRRLLGPFTFISFVCWVVVSIVLTVESSREVVVETIRRVVVISGGGAGE
jgi:hypothetical protein